MRDLWHIDDVNNAGIYLHFSKGFNKELKHSIQAFVKWIRRKYRFPIKLHITIVEAEFVITYLTEEKVSASIFFPYDKHQLPHARVSTGDYKHPENDDFFSAKCSILASVAHEITHYYQWLKDETGQGELSERQARYKSVQIVNKYLDDCYSNGIEPFE